MGRERHARGRRGLTVALVLAVVAVAPGPEASAAGSASFGGADVTVTDGVGKRTVTHLDYLADLQPAQDVFETRYTKRTPPDREGHAGTDTEKLSGTSASAIAALAGVDSSDVTGMTFSPSKETTNGPGTAQLTGDEVRDGFTGDDAGGRFLIVLPNNRPEGELKAVRPLRRPDDTNNVDVVPSTGAGDPPLQITIESRGRSIGVSVSGPATSDANTPVTFSAKADGGAEVRSVRWTLSDGTTGSTGPGEPLPHTFTADGRYRVRATLTTRDGATGVGFATIVVGTPASSPDPSVTTPSADAAGSGGAPGTGTAPANGAPSGPNTGAGSAIGAAPGSPEDRPETASGNRPSRTSRAGRTSGSSVDATDRRRRSGGASATAPPSPTPGSPPRGASAAATDDRVRAGRENRPAGSADRAAPDTVSGVLVASRTASVVPIAPAEVARAAAARRGAEPRGTSDLAWVLGPLAVLGLLGAGALRELRPGRRLTTTTRMPTT